MGFDLAFNSANIKSGHSETVLKGVSRHESLLTIEAVVRPECRCPRRAWERYSIVVSMADVDDISEARGSAVLLDRLTVRLQYCPLFLWNSPKLTDAVFGIE